MLKSLVYVSSAASLMTPTQLLELLQQARRNNERDRITGMLLYHDGNFMQVFEGEEKQVARLHAKILVDPRHKNVITLLKESLKSRQFGDWSMAFENVSLLNEDDRAHISPFLSQPFDSDYFSDSPNQALKLLLSFKELVEQR